MSRLKAKGDRLVTTSAAADTYPYRAVVIPGNRPRDNRDPLDGTALRRAVVACGPSEPAGPHTHGPTEPGWRRTNRPAATSRWPSLERALEAADRSAVLVSPATVAPRHQAACRRSHAGTASSAPQDVRHRTGGAAGTDRPAELGLRRGGSCRSGSLSTAPSADSLASRPGGGGAAQSIGGCCFMPAFTWRWKTAWRPGC